MNPGFKSDLAAFDRGFKAALMLVYQSGIALEVAAPHVPEPDHRDAYKGQHWVNQLLASAARICVTADTIWSEWQKVPEGTLSAEYERNKPAALAKMQADQANV